MGEIRIALFLRRPRSGLLRTQCGPAPMSRKIRTVAPVVTAVSPVFSAKLCIAENYVNTRP